MIRIREDKYNCIIELSDLEAEWMMKKVKNLVVSVVLLFILVPPMSVSADLGPKPSVVVEFAGLEEENYYVTLLSEQDSTGPWSHGNEYYDYLGDEKVFEKFSEYEDEDGYYFLSYMEDCSEDDTFEWTYYPPELFKILIYFPEYDRFMPVDGIYERYAFDSYFKVEITDVEKIAGSGVEITDAEKIDDSEAAVNAETRAEPSYDYTMEILSFAARVVITIAIEILIAVFFAYRDKRSLAIITVTNVITQVILNVLLNVVNYRSGQYAFVFHYVWMECVVFALEGVLYAKLIGRENLKTGKKYYPYLYAAVANIVSFILGLWIARMVPGIF